ncbi:hypothetical protein EVAR_21492_1 [Eumeta japonica]|uniref:Uncharacterized protein n=1 Tax=Eumeta variegata TaxID=151549 RepID=A0A4C1UZ21_EUMVA|nr:hypothetical protein EVAR_21492_1 [Eumeta japonica]
MHPMTRPGRPACTVVNWIVTWSTRPVRRRRPRTRECHCHGTTAVEQEKCHVASTYENIQVGYSGCAIRSGLSRKGVKLTIFASRHVYIYSLKCINNIRL